MTGRVLFEQAWQLHRQPGRSSSVVEAFGVQLKRGTGKVKPLLSEVSEVKQCTSY